MAYADSMDMADAREVSHHLLGNSFLMEVGAAIGRFTDPQFIAKDVVSATSIERNLAATAIAKLERSGLIKRLGRVGREVPFERSQSVYWGFCQALLDELTGT